MNIQILRKHEVLKITGLSNSTLYNRIGEGIFCPPISLGDRAVGFLQHEVEAVLNALIAHSTKEEMKELVFNLLNQRNKRNK